MGLARIATGAPELLTACCLPLLWPQCRLHTMHCLAPSPQGARHPGMRTSVSVACTSGGVAASTWSRTEPSAASTPCVHMRTWVCGC